MDLAHRLILNWNLARSAMYTVQDAHYRIPGIRCVNFLLLIGILNAHTPL
jgi:hypothetical protein